MNSRDLKSPEYQVILTDNLLPNLVNRHFESVASSFHQRGFLTDDQYNKVNRRHADKNDGEKELIDTVLLAIRASSNPCEPFVEFIDILEQCGNKIMTKYIKDTIKPCRKAIYRDLLRPIPGKNSVIW